MLSEKRKKRNRKRTEAKLSFGFTRTKQIMMVTCPGLCCHNCRKVVHKMLLPCLNLHKLYFEDLKCLTKLLRSYVGNQIPQASYYIYLCIATLVIQIPIQLPQTSPMTSFIYRIIYMRKNSSRFNMFTVTFYSNFTGHILELSSLSLSTVMTCPRKLQWILNKQPCAQWNCSKTKAFELNFLTFSYLPCNAD